MYKYTVRKRGILGQCIALELCWVTSPPRGVERNHYRYHALYGIELHKSQAADSAIIGSPTLETNMASYIRFVNRKQ